MPSFTARQKQRHIEWVHYYNLSGVHYYNMSGCIIKPSASCHQLPRLKKKKIEMASVAKEDKPRSVKRVAVVGAGVSSIQIEITRSGCYRS